MKRTIAFISENDYRNEMGYDGFLVSSNGTINYDFIPTTKGQGKLLAHDLLEHVEHAHSNPNCDELMALGVVLYHRDYDFYDLYYGRDGFAYEIAEQLLHIDENIKLPTSASYVVKERLDYAWDSIKLALIEEHERHYTETDFRRLKSIAYRFLSKGYNRVQGLECRYAFNFDRLFNKVACTFDEAWNTMLYRAEMNPEITFTFEVKYGDCSVIIREDYPNDWNYWDDESKRYWKSERFFINR